LNETPDQACVAEYKPNWLLVKNRDEYARPENEWNVTDARPESVASGRDLDAIATVSDRVWHSDRNRADPSALPGARAMSMPAWSPPPEAKRSRAVPDGDAWLHEIAIDDERIVAKVGRGRTWLLGADGSERTTTLAGLVGAIQSLPVGDAIVDCVATSVDADGHTSRDRPADVLFAFDLPYLDGYDLGRVPLVKRKTLLASLIAQIGPRPALHYTDHVVGRGPETFAQACSLAAPAIVSKKVDSRYPPAASAWRGLPCKGREPARPAPSRNTTEGTREPRVARVKLTHPDRVLYPEVGVTKLDLAHFYERVAERMLPYVVDRPLTLIRGPVGVNGEKFYVRHPGDWTPTELRQIDIKEGTGSGTAMVVDDVAGLVALAQMNVLEIHPWNARTRDLERPDRMVFDMDPGPEVQWADVVEAAKYVRNVLTTVDLESFVKTTGGKRLHVVVPLAPAASWDDTLEFSRLIAQGLAQFEPKRFSAGLAKAPRASKIFVDYLRNRSGATAVSAYSVRAQATATVSVPVSWAELGSGTRGLAFHVADVDRWYPEDDPWAGAHNHQQKLTLAKIDAARRVQSRPTR
jgi:bifunctional non-homologous end joining protein LigD